jgi:hypothetical protein
MSLVFNSKTYTGQQYNGPQVTYSGAGKTVSVKDDVRLSATPPKASAVFSGVGRTDAKLTRTLTLTGALTPKAEAIVDSQVRVPVGSTEADVDALLTDFGAFLAGASFKAHVKAQQIAF